MTRFFLLVLLASPARAGDWRDEVVYFLMTDRFADGDVKNDDLGFKEFDPKNGAYYSGGDIAGIRSKLDYIQGLGASAVWLTPPVANVWNDPALKMSGYHGYWARDFMKLDEHLGTLEDYRGLADDLHRRKMKLIQDIVVNHTGDFFGSDLKLKSGIVPSTGPTQRPFNLNDPSDPLQRGASVYHWTSDITDYANDEQRLKWQMSGLDDLNTSSPAVRQALRESYDFWISSVGVDGFRLDTAHYVEHEFWRDFVRSKDKDFLTLGEVWIHAEPFSDKADKEAAEYLGTKEQPELSAVLNFPLAMELRSVFAKGAAPARLKYRLESLNKFYRDGLGSGNFVDNHDMARFLSEGSEDGLAQALAAVFTVPGIPVVYAGTEQGFRETRGSMFKEGYGSGGQDHFDAGHPLYQLIQELARVRRENDVFRRGTLTPLYGEASGAGALAYRLDMGKEKALVLFNTADEPVLLAELETGLETGVRMQPVFLRHLDRFAELRVGERLSMLLPPRAVLALKSAGPAAAPPAPAAAVIDPLPAGPLGEKAVEVRGTASRDGNVLLIVDGRLSRPIRARREGGRWSASLDAGRLADGEHTLIAMVGEPEKLGLSKPRGFSVSIPWKRIAEVEDPVGDDRGPLGTYRYPLAPGFEGRADIERVSLYRRGPGAKWVVKMAKGLSDGWNPPLGFDHVCFNIFLSWPDGRGVRVLPRMNAEMPEGQTWDFGLFLGGWTVALYPASGSTAGSMAPPVQPPPKVKSDKKAGTVEIVFDLDAFRGVGSFDGAEFNVTTWDYDGMEGGLRPLAPEPADYVFGGGKADGVKWMDAAGPVK
ncbi:MAG TPA: alpha-amylase [Elusimicrobia bacterium]|nr:alpha-amylase [Elusimicrobiota bacterium]